MAVTTVNISENERLLSGRGLRAKVDAFVSGRMQHAVSQAARVKGFQRCRQPESFVAPASGQDETCQLELRPLGEDIISAAIPTFFIGRNKAGLWIAREASGRIGGLFLLKSSALAFARTQGGSAGWALVFPSERFELDVENEGNPFARQFGSLLRVATGLGREIARCALTAILALIVLTGIVALQAAIHVHVYLWR